MMGCTTAPGEKTLAPARALHKDHTYELVSKVAYLIGVPLRIFENEHEPPKLELYDQLERDKNARIIRNLCIIRTAIERNYKRINDAMRISSQWESMWFRREEASWTVRSKNARASSTFFLWTDNVM